MSFLKRIIRRVLPALLVLNGCMRLSGGPLDETWYLEGYITTGDPSSIDALTRIHGTAKFTADEIQLSTNIGDFTRKAAMAGMVYENAKTNEFIYTDYSFDPPRKTKEKAVVEKVKVKLTPVDESTMILSYGASFFHCSDRNDWLSFEGVGAVLTKRPVSSRLFPFDGESVQLWLQPDHYQGVSTELDLFDRIKVSELKNFLNIPIMNSTQYSRKSILGGSPGSGFFLDWQGPKELKSTQVLNELTFESRNDGKTELEKYWSAPDQNGNVKWVGSLYESLKYLQARIVHLGDGRVFWFLADASIWEAVYWDPSPRSSFRFMPESYFECGVLEQKLWFNATFSQQVAGMESAPLEGSAVGGMNASAVPRPCAALVKQIRGEVYEVYGGVRKPLSLGDWVRQGSQIETSAKSFVQLVFLDRSHMNVGPNSQMKVQEFTPKDSGFIDLVKGKIRSQVSRDYLLMKDSKKSKLFLKTKNAVMGVRGTEFEISYNEANDIGTTQLQMIEGSVEFTNLDTGVTTLVANQERIGVECPVKNVGSAGPEVAVLDENSKSLVSGSSTQSLGARLPQTSSEPVVFRIRNIGRKKLEGIKATLSGPNSSDFMILSNPQTSIPAIIGETTLAVQFTPSSVGMRKAVLEIASSDVDESPFRIFLQGQGLAEVATLSVEWPSGSPLVDGTSRKFGSVVIGSKSATRVISLRNIGAEALEGIQVRLSGKHKGDFTSTQAPIQLQPGESATLKVSFRPGAEGTRTATLEIQSSDAENPVFKVPMTGLGIKK